MGADKQPPYMPISERTSVFAGADPHYAGSAGDLDPVRAMLQRQCGDCNLSILLPMVTSIDEVDEARRSIERAGREASEMIVLRDPETARHYAGSTVNGIYAAASG